MGMISGKSHRASLGVPLNAADTHSSGNHIKLRRSGFQVISIHLGGRQISVFKKETRRASHPRWHAMSIDSLAL